MQASFWDYIAKKFNQSYMYGVLIKESSMQLIKCLLDTYIGYSTFSLIFKSQKGSIKALNFHREVVA